ncbi:MAG: hypothetical protein LC789_01225 [Actinobacteria bacterium]|nr:hypothetical protein [Actinomycetota bacterium]MCA1722541.1 hypothetical protein [Actinomycetota bacterium]
MSRLQIIAVSVVCCVFGVLALRGPAEYRTWAYVVNVVLAIVAFAFAGRDLTERGWRKGYLFAGTYILPLIGTFVYIALSNRPKQSPVTV